jgi:transcriptional regulator with PAS, ATPase and Fis domain
MRTMTNHSWVDEFPGAVTVCDPEGIILEMNQKSAENFKDDGGMELIGKNMFDCHPEPARTKTRELLEKKRLNFYTTEKKGVHKLIYQSPWYKNGKYCGFVELSLVIPSEIPHFIRDP